MSNWAVIVAAGKSVRFGDELPKQFHEVCGKPLLSWTIDRFEQADTIDGIVLVVSDEYQLYATQSVLDPFNFHKVSKVVAGGDTRQKSTLNGLLALPGSVQLVAIHDGVRPLVHPDDIDKVVSSGADAKAALLACPAVDTVKQVRNGSIEATLDRKTIWLAQTPQVFEYKLILDAHQEFARNHGGDKDVTDDSSLIEEKGIKVRVVAASSPNIKVTTFEDLNYVKALLSRELNG